MSTQRILIVDDHQLFSAGLSSLLRAMDPNVDVYELDSAITALSLLEQGRQFDLVLVDIKMPSLSGIEFITALSARQIKTRLALISGYSDHNTIQTAIDNGAAGYIPKTCSPSMTLDGIRTLLAGKNYVPPHLCQHIYFGFKHKENDELMVQNPPTGPALSLNDRQLEVVKLLSAGKSNKEMAYILGLSHSTIKFHLSALFRKLGVTTRTECVVAAVRRSLISP